MSEPRPPAVPPSPASRPTSVAMVMPPVTNLSPDDAIDRWPTVTATCAALTERGDVHPTVHGRHSNADAQVVRDGVTYSFHASDAALVGAIAAEHPDVVHVHGLGWARLLRRLGAVGVPVVVQHHGETVFTGRARSGHRLVRRHVAGYLFTGASTGHVRPWIDAGVIRPDARCFEVLEAAAMLPDDDGPAVTLDGSPAVLWVGRLVPGKDPVTAVRAFAQVAEDHPAGHLHVLATDRTLESAVRQAIADAGASGNRIHLHPPVAHDRIGAWYSAAHVYFSTSLHEAAGYSLLEAMSRGCVPSVTDIPAHRAVIGDVGAAFPTGDVVAAARALAAAATMPREPISERSRRLLSWGNVAGQLAGVYCALRD